jgi:Undecaprenyl-phosphate glucose phosphotransferase
LVIVAKGLVLGGIIVQAFLRLFNAQPMSASFLIEFAFLNFFGLSTVRVGMRFLLRDLRRRGWNTKGMLIVGSGPRVIEIAEKIEAHSFYGYEIMGVCGPRWTPGYTDVQYLGTLEVLSRHLLTHRVDEVIIALPCSRSELQRATALCEAHGIHTRIAPDTLDVFWSERQSCSLDGIPLVNVRDYPTERVDYVFLKRLLDIVGSVLFLVLLAPVMILVTLVVRLTQTGPVIFRQERIGLNGRRFWMYKFKTMKGPESCSTDTDTGWTQKDDPRITAVGRFLRKTSLDELPQLINVLTGDMSLVGPRPERPYFVELFKREIPNYMIRHYMKCGMTGWAQVNGWRGNTSIRKRIEYDLYYMQHWALWFDLKILWLTFSRSLNQRNAY